MGRGAYYNIFGNKLPPLLSHESLLVLVLTLEALNELGFRCLKEHHAMWNDAMWKTDLNLLARTFMSG